MVTLQTYNNRRLDDTKIVETKMQNIVTFNSTNIIKKTDSPLASKDSVLHTKRFKNNISSTGEITHGWNLTVQ